MTADEPLTDAADADRAGAADPGAHQALGSRRGPGRIDTYEQLDGYQALPQRAGRRTRTS